MFKKLFLFNKFAKFKRKKKEKQKIKFFVYKSNSDSFIFWFFVIDLIAYNLYKYEKMIQYKTSYINYINEELIKVCLDLVELVLKRDLMNKNFKDIIKLDI